MTQSKNKYLLEKRHDAVEELKDDNKSLQQAIQEAKDAEVWLDSRKVNVKKTEIMLESIEGEYIDENIDTLQSYFMRRYNGDKDGFESNFENWLEGQPFEALRTIVETPHRLKVCSLAPDGTIRRPIHDTVTGRGLDDIVSRGEDKRQHDAEEGTN